MAHLIFQLQGQFRHGFTQLRQVKDGVVAESMVALRFRGNDSPALAGTELYRPIGGSDSNHAAEAGRPLFTGYIPEPCQQVVYSLYVGSAFTGITGLQWSWLTAQRVNLQTGVISQG